MSSMRTFSARETEWLRELDGIELAGFWRRAFAFFIDWTLVSIVLSVTVAGGMTAYLKMRERQGHKVPTKMNFDFRPGDTRIKSSDPAFDQEMGNEFVHIFSDIAVPVLYFGLLTWKGNGRSPGKRLLKIRVVSIVHRHLSLWHSIERALATEPLRSKAASVSCNSSSIPTAAAPRTASPRPSSSPKAATRRCSPSSPTPCFPTTATNLRHGSPTNL